MAVKAQDITGDADNGIQNLRGWSVKGSTLVFRIRKDGLVTGQIIATVNGDSHVLYPDIVDASGGAYFEVVSGTLTEGVLYYV